ncbi:hypothetical protein Ccrd_008246 [Cynara cardunculus var. scolymus]|uniref:Uncharacterized protein n=1 Tax=Cynara cardunculus var. scolymus TaxID=59895 RepID=A0A103XFE6_CYNCS|nr:hypothetical protein Ccrd_008246 [Cynara cardunculus var. scolymus]
MQSVFGIEWKNHGNYAKFVPRDFVLGPFIQGLNDPVHHKEFGTLSIILYQPSIAFDFQAKMEYTYDTLGPWALDSM